MVDTIVFRLHDLKKHDQLVNELNTNFKGTTKNTVYISDDQAEMIRNSETIDGKNFLIFFANSNNSIHHLHYSSQEKMNSSGHYHINAFINYDKDCVEFNFSVPKYIFGTNILMFCVHSWNKNFNYASCSTLEYNLKSTYDRLIKFISGFFKRGFVGDNIVDFSLVEIVRIDISFNQVFDNKKFALDYLEYQKKVRKKHLRADSNSFRAYDTSLMYITKRYSAKIYHKGTEYKKHDRSENEKIKSTITKKNKNIYIKIFSGL